MHLLNTSTASLDDAVEPIDLRQPPADVLILSFSDSDLIGLSRAAMESGASVRLTHLKNLRHPMSVDLWIDHTARHAKLIIVRMLGGLDWWRYGVEQLQQIARTKGIALAILPGEDRDDPRLTEASTLPAEQLDQLLRHFRAGGPTNMRALLNLATDHLTPSLFSSASRDMLCPSSPEADRNTPPAGAWFPDHGTLTLDRALATLTTNHPTVPIIFYRSALLADDLQPVAALCAALTARNIAPLPIFVTSLKDPVATAFVTEALAHTAPAVIVTMTAFAAGGTLFDATTAPVLQVANAVTRRDGWQSSPRGLNGADLAMNVVLPELDGRVLAGVIAFKDFIGAEDFGGLYARPEPDRVEQVADRIARQIHLQTTPPAASRVAMILPDYPGAPGRTGWAVGLDAPESVRRAMLGLADAGYTLGPIPTDPRALLDLLESETESFLLETYRAHLATLPCEAREAIIAAWGEPETDTSLRGGAFHFRAMISGNITIALAPDRGRSADRRADYHDPALPPRHALLAFGLWLQTGFKADAIVHMGAHGTLEWLPGKAVALSASCWPELVLGALPVIYPFIVNNPGEAAQAKRRIAAITLGHLPPPAAETGLSGKMRDLERLVDEYAAADGMDPRRRDRLAGLILDEAQSCGVASTLGLTPTTEAGDTLRQIDAWLCDLKDLTVKDGLHIYGHGSGDRAESADSERKALLTALSGRRIQPGPAGSPARGRRDVLPTGRNLTTADPRMLPTQTAMDLGRLAADEIIRLHCQEQGEPPRSIVLDLWGSATLRTGGEEIAQGLALLGCQPIWDHGTGRVTGIEVLPPAIMGRARVDVTFRISGLFRDLFPAQIALLALAVKTVAARNETDAENPLAAAHRGDAAISRIFGTAPGAYGAGIEDALASGDWTDKSDLAAAYIAAGSHSYETDGEGNRAPGAFATRLRTADALVHAHDNPDRDLLEGSADAAFIGGFAAATGKQVIILDTTNPNTPRARPLDQAIARIVHGRALDPRFIAGQMRHGPRGASELLETVDRLLDFAETAGVPDHLIDLLHAAYIADETVNDFMIRENPEAARAMAERFLSALRRNIWHPRRNNIEPGINEMLTQLAR
jgi:cobaltochelatase CobN